MVGVDEKAIISWWQKEISYSSFNCHSKGTRNGMVPSVSFLEFCSFEYIIQMKCTNFPSSTPSPSPRVIWLLVVLISAQIVSKSDHKLYIVKPIRFRCFFIEFRRIKIILINVSPRRRRRRRRRQSHHHEMPVSVPHCALISGVERKKKFKWNNMLLAHKGHFITA